MLARLLRATKLLALLVILVITGCEGVVNGRIALGPQGIETEYRVGGSYGHGGPLQTAFAFGGASNVYGEREQWFEAYSKSPVIAAGLARTFASECSIPYANVVAATDHLRVYKAESLETLTDDEWRYIIGNDRRPDYRYGRLTSRQMLRLLELVTTGWRLAEIRRYCARFNTYYAS